MQPKSLFLLLLCCAIGIEIVEPYRYLMVLTSGGRSHFIMGNALARGLVAAGHEVTVVSPYPLKQPIVGYHDINVPNIIRVTRGDIPALWKSVDKSLLVNLIHHYYMGFRMTRGLFEDENFQELLSSNRTFDAIICETFYNDAHYGLAERFNAPLIGLSTGGTLSFIDDMVGSPSPASYVPHIMLPFNHHMSFKQRLINVAFLACERLLLDYYYLPGQAAMYKEFFPQNKRDFYEMRRDASLVLLNQHVSLSFPRPYAPNMIEVGGWHLDGKLKPLPADIEKFINGAEHGVIYFSMGSNLKSKDISAEKLQMILEVFGKLKQRVLWKFELSDLPNKPANVYISDWFPQNEILAHEKVLVFITHGGQLSTTEAMYYGKPVIGLPIFSDQFFNMVHAEQGGFGIMLDYRKFTAKQFSQAIERITSDPSYTQKVRIMSYSFRDQQQSPLERAVYWVEHVSRTQGAPYLKSAAQHLSWWQYHNVDVLLVLIAGLLLVCFCVSYGLRLLIAKSSGHKQQKISRKLKRK